MGNTISHKFKEYNLFKIRDIYESIPYSIDDECNIRIVVVIKMYNMENKRQGSIYSAYPKKWRL